MLRLTRRINLKTIGYYLFGGRRNKKLKCWGAIITWIDANWCWRVKKGENAEEKIIKIGENKEEAINVSWKIRAIKFCTQPNQCLKLKLRFWGGRMHYLQRITQKKEITSLFYFKMENNKYYRWKRFLIEYTNNIDLRSPRP